MTRPSFAATRRVNPPGVEPGLTHEQVWKGLEIKAREPLQFVPVITSCEVISEDGNKMSRLVSFKNGPKLKEDIELYDPTIAYFEIGSTGNRVLNLISYDEEGNLLLTFSFANGIPSIPDDNAVPPLEERNEKLGSVVQHTIDRLREMAKEGKL